MSNAFGVYLTAWFITIVTIMMTNIYCIITVPPGVCYVKLKKWRRGVNRYIALSPGKHFRFPFMSTVVSNPLTFSPIVLPLESDAHFVDTGVMLVPARDGHGMLVISVRFAYHVVDANALCRSAAFTEEDVSYIASARARSAVREVAATVAINADKTAYSQFKAAFAAGSGKAAFAAGAGAGVSAEESAFSHFTLAIHTVNIFSKATPLDMK